MKVHEHSVVTEKQALDEKIDKLNAFLRSDAFGVLSAVGRSLLLAQVHAMASYSQILGARIERLQP